jgi:hypothetical protein
LVVQVEVLGIVHQHLLLEVEVEQDLQEQQDLLEQE